MTDPTNVHEPVPQSAKLTAREKKWIIYDVGCPPPSSPFTPNR